MPYFTIEKSFLFLSLDISEKEKEKMRKFLEFLENSNVGEIIEKYVNNKTEKGGRPGYNYYRLFAVIIYGFAFKRSTLRELEDACKNDIRYIWLLEQRCPPYSKFCDFINRVIAPNEQEIFSRLNWQIIKETKICLDDAFIDGTKFEANANKYKFVWKPNRHYKNLSIKINEIIKEDGLINDYNDEIYIRSSTVAFAISHLNEKIASCSSLKLQKDKKALVNMLNKCLEYEEKNKICGENRKSYYKTDKDATAMALKADYYSGLGSNMHAAYNIQHLVIRGFIFSYHVSQNRNDIYDFINVIDYFSKLYGFFPNNICADAGYGSLVNYRYMKKHGIHSYVKHQSWEGNRSGKNPDCYSLNDDDTITCLNGNIGYKIELENRHPKKAESVFYKINGCNSCGWMPFCKKYFKNQNDDFRIFEVVIELEKLKQESNANLLSPKGIEIRVNRSIQVEGSFAIEKQDYQYTRIRRRGIEKVSTEIMLYALGLNIAKMFRYFETGNLNKYWIAPDDLITETFKKPNMKRLAKKGRRINKACIEGTQKKTVRT